MTAVVWLSSSTWSVLSLYLLLLTVVPIGLMWAPQPVKRDKRVIAVVIVVVALLLLVPPLFAFDSNVCTYAWWAIECWLFGH